MTQGIVLDIDDLIRQKHRSTLFSQIRHKTTMTLARLSYMEKTPFYVQYEQHCDSALFLQL